MADLKIRVIGTLNSDATTKEINSVLSTLESKMNKLKLDIQIDEKVSKTLADFSKAMENHTKISQDLNKVIKEEKKVIKEADGATKEYIRQHLKSGEIIEKEIVKINKKNQATQQETQVINEQNKALQKQGELLKNKYDIDAQGNSKLKSQTFKDGSTTTTTNTQTGKSVAVRNLEQERLATQTLIQSKQKLKATLTQLNSEGKVSATNLSKLNNAIDNSKNIKQVQRLEANLNNLNKIRENEFKLEQARKQAQINAQRINTTHAGFVDTKGVQQYLDSVNKLTPRTANLNQQLQKSSTQFKQVSQNAKSAAGAAQQAGMSFGEMLSTAMVKFCRLHYK